MKVCSANTTAVPDDVTSTSLHPQLRLYYCQLPATDKSNFVFTEDRTFCQNIFPRPVFSDGEQL